MHKKIFLAIAFVFLSTYLMAQHRVLMHLATNDTTAWKMLMNNIKNMKAALGDSVKIEVVAHGFGLDLLTKGKTTQQEKITQYSKMGVDFLACEAAMAERKVPREAIITESGFVKMAIVEIIRRQEEGWTYIKAGF